MSRYDLDRAALAEILEDLGQPSYRVGQVWDGLYRRLAEPDALTELPKAVRAALASDGRFGPALQLADESVADRGETTKWLWRLTDGTPVETVLMHYPGRSTVCVSTQAGCAMACSFCATGQAGFDRQLSVGEIVEQVVRASRVATAGGRRVSRVVFMGMGEPLANYEAVMGSVARLHDDIGLSARHLTLSTVGIVPGIRRLADETLPVNLAVSLHAANDVLRDELVPINRRYPLDMLVDACLHYLSAKGRRLSLEWAMIQGVNDRPADAAELAGVAHQLGAHVNLIPLNPTPGFGVPGTAPSGVRLFRDRLLSLGVNVTVRRTRGTAIDAACGQLAARPIVVRPPIAVRTATL
jgi:23S rRNA (adenine2503-C2)-methyltransferase